MEAIAGLNGARAAEGAQAAGAHEAVGVDAHLSAASLGISGPARRGIMESVMLDDLPEVLTVEEAAAVLRVGRTAAYQLTQQWRASNGTEGLPVRKLGRLLRVPRAELIRMTDAGTRP